MALERRNDAGNGVMTAQGKAGEKTLREPLKRKVKGKIMTGLRLRQDENVGQPILGAPGKMKTSQGVAKKVMPRKTPPLKKINLIAEQNTVADANIQEKPKMEDCASSNQKKLVGNPQLVEEYMLETKKYLEHRELLPELQIFGKYLEGQTNVLPTMRALVVDWMAGVVLQLSLHPETLQLAVSCLDRFLQVEVAKVGKEKLQLIGATALLIASKYEENYPPEIAEICYFSGATIGNFRRVLNIYRWRGFGGLITRGRVVDAWQPWLQLGTPLAPAVPSLGTLC